MLHVAHTVNEGSLFVRELRMNEKVIEPYVNNVWMGQNNKRYLRRDFLIFHRGQIFVGQSQNTCKQKTITACRRLLLAAPRRSLLHDG